MGNCSSCEPAALAKGTSKAKLILEDGKLEEFSNPVRVSQILKRSPSCFICSADDLDFDEYVSAIHDDKELQIGQLYFELPADWLKSQLTAHQMAALAVKASLALNIGGPRRGDHGCCWCGPRRPTDPILEFNNDQDDEEGRPIMASGGYGGDACSLGLAEKGRKKCSHGGGGKGRKLVAILEDDGEENQ